MARIVIDASVLVKWYVQETHSGKAIRLRDRHVNGEIELAAPFLIFYETLNALKYTGLFSTKELKEIALSIRNYGIKLFAPEKKAIEFALEAAQNHKLTIYDGSYLGLAMSLGAEFITADQKLIDQLSGDYSKAVRHLDSF